MRPHHPTLPCLLSLLALLVLPSSANPTAAELRPDILFTRRGEFVHVKPMRPLTLDAHVSQFAYEPLGIEIAVVGQEAQGDTTVYFVKVVDARSGHEMERLTQAVSTEDSGGGFRLLGWSASGKYLMLQRYAIDSADEPGRNQPMQYLRWDISAGTPVARTIDPASMLPLGARALNADDYVSPTGRWLLFEQHSLMRDDAGKFSIDKIAYLLYDPERNTYRTLTVPEKSWGEGWADAGHLRVRHEDQDLRLDVTSGQTSPFVAAPTPAPVSRLYPDLTLDVEERLQRDTKSGGRIDSHILWLRRTPSSKLPLGVAAAGLTPGDDDPQAAWSPNGKQIAFLAHGDLCVTDLATPGPLPEEKLALGLPLTCPEERQLAMTDLKQIGLALTQYTQDYDETFPPADDVDERIYPYLKSRSLYGVGGNHWTYVAPKELGLAAMEEPAQTEIGTLDTPCAHNVLYADGHVKSFTKGQETAP